MLSNELVLDNITDTPILLLHSFRHEVTSNKDLNTDTCEVQNRWTLLTYILLFFSYQIGFMLMALDQVLIFFFNYFVNSC